MATKSIKPELSKTQQAMALIKTGKTVRQAARAVDLSEAGVYAAISREKAKDLKAKGCCPTCGQKLPKK